MRRGAAFVAFALRHAAGDDTESRADVGFQAPCACEERKMRRLLRKVVPGIHEIYERKSLRRIFGRTLLSADLWRLNRNSVAWAVSNGLFMAWMPIPFQMVPAAGVSLVVRCNLPVSVAMAWISNPVTVVPLFFAAYRVGAWMLGVPPVDMRFEPSLRWLLDELGTVWEPFLLGCFVMGLGSAILGQAVVRLFWRVYVVASWRERRIRRRRGGHAAATIREEREPKR